MLNTWKNVGTVAVASGLLLMGLGTRPAQAAHGEASLLAKNSEPQKVSNAQLHEGLQVLRATKQTLEAADHDYGGHRVDAVKAISIAQKQLKLALEAENPNGHKHAGKPGIHAGKPAGGQEAQAVSDMKLGESIAVLAKTIAFLEHADHDYGGHRVDAMKDLQTAVNQLQLALQFEKNKVQANGK